MKLHHILLAIISLGFLAMPAKAQTLKLQGLGGESYIIPAADTVSLSYERDFFTIPVAASCDYTVAADAEWLTAKKESNGNFTLFSTYHAGADDRFAKATLTAVDGSVSRTVVVRQQHYNFTASASKITGITATDTNHNGTEDASKTVDGNFATLYHSPYGGGGFPFTLTYKFSAATHVDYAVYTPRMDGNANGNFIQVRIDYQQGAGSEWALLKDMNFGGSGSAIYIPFGNDGLDGITSVRFTVQSGTNNMASCAEMEFFQEDRTLRDELNTYFADKILTQLKSGVTAADVEKIKHPMARTFVSTILQGTYDKNFRVAEYEPFRPVGDLQSELRNSHTYCNHENPTGITFTEGETVCIIVDGLQSDPLALQVRNFGPTNFTSASYPLHNGINIVTIRNRGNGYINYYTANYKTAPKVKIHIFNGTINGLFDLTAGHTNADWVSMLAKAPGDCFDFKGNYIIGTFPVATLKQNTPDKGRELVQLYDNIVQKEREVMGLFKFGRNPKNHQTVITVASSGGLYHASNDGFCVPVNALRDPTSLDHFDVWGAGHELGHNNQTRGFVYTGLTEVTNNIHSAWCQHTLDKGVHRLEDEAWGSPRGERIEAYLEGVRQGLLWQLQPGPDSYGKTFDPVSVADEDENGNKTTSVNTPCYNHDVFVKLVPLWQLLLYTEESCVGASPEAYGKLFEGLRTYQGNENSTNGKQQIKFMRSFCDSTQINFLPFFEKAGLLKPAHFYQSDYSNGWIVITQQMVDDLKAHVAAKGYAEAPAGLNWLTVYNMDRFKNKTPLAEGALNAGCSVSGTNYIRVEHSQWPGAVGFKTYNAYNVCVANTVFGYNDKSQSTTYTYVKWPVGAKYIKAVAYDGTEVKIYEK